MEPLISQVKRLSSPVAKRVASIVPIAPPANDTAAAAASSTVAAGHEGGHLGGHALDLADEVAGHVDHVRGEVAERAAAGLGGIEAPHALARGVGAPRLPVGAAEVVHLAELARLEDLARAPHGRHEAVVERAHVHDPGLGHRGEHLARLGGVERQRLLAEHVLAGPRGGDRGLGVQVVREQVLEHLHLGVRHHLLPVRHVAGEAEALGELGALRLVAARHGHQPRRDRRAARSCGPA